MLKSTRFKNYIDSFGYFLSFSLGKWHNIEKSYNMFISAVMLLSQQVSKYDTVT